MVWSPELDAVIAAPRHHRLALENEFVRVLETVVEPGEVVPMHTHSSFAATYFVTFGDFVRRGEHGELLVDSRTIDHGIVPGRAVWSDPLGPHTLENVGTQTLVVIVVEVKGARLYQ